MARDREKEQRFEAQAKRIKEHLNSTLRYDHEFLPPPFCIEFTGSPSSGKTTTITELDKFLRRHEFRVWRPQEGAEVIRHIPRTTPLYNVRTGLYALTMLLDVRHGHAYDIVLFDRCIFDAYCWMLYWNEKQKLTTEEQELIQSFFLSRLWSVDIAYIMVCDPETAIAREHRIALSHKLGETTNPKTLQALVRRYKDTYKVLSPKYPQLHLIDTTHLDEESMVEIVATKTLDILEHSIQTQSHP